MKVKDLIEELQKLNPELLVLVRGYEGGVDEVKNICSCKAELDVYKNFQYYGDHALLFDGDERHSDTSTVVDAICLQR